jgi:S-DNA-T family DNA segregation ATPase FtsK/SpoIIIE
MTAKTVTQPPLRVRDLVPWLLILAVLPVVFWHPARQLVLVLAAAVVGLRLAVAIVRFTMLPRSAYPHYLPARWHRFRWHRLARNLGLAYVDRHLGGLDSRRPPKVVYPRVRFRPDPFGWVVKTRLVPGVSRPEYEKQAEHLANSWRCHRVGISQPKPGHLLVRAMRRDPLAEPLSADVLPVFDGRRLMLGRDEWGQLRTVSLANLSGSVVGGSPGTGKSQWGASIAVQLAPVRNSAWYVLDGGGGADWECWTGRAVRFATDNLAEARDVLEDAHARMLKRLANLAADLGTRNAWSVGPSAEYPMVWVPIDESSVYLDLEAAKAIGREAEAHVRAIRGLVVGMLRRGRKALFHVSLFAQKCSTSSIPPDLRDLAGLRLAFGCPTTENAVAVLGDDIRLYPTLSPVRLQGPEHAGVCVARLATGSDVYTRLRVPYVSEDQANPNIIGIHDRVTCPLCNGTGLVAGTKCRLCNGTGTVPADTRICVGCVGESEGCSRCKGTGVDPDITAPVLTAL